MPGIDGAWLVEGAPPSSAIIQDPASIAVGAAVEAAVGERVLDVAAAPGGKTRQLVDAGAVVVATDIHPRRVRDARRRAPEAAWVVADGRRLPFDEASFDAVLVDAPCTGLGTLRRRPEIIHRMGPGDVTALAETGRRPGRRYGDGWMLAPHLGPTDGMFVARIDL